MKDVGKIWILIIVCVLLIIPFGYYYNQHQEKVNEENEYIQYMCTLKENKGYVWSNLAKEWIECNNKSAKIRKMIR